MVPIIEYRKDILGTSIFEWLSSGKIFSLPRASYSELEETKLGRRKILIQGQIEFGLSPDNLAELKAEYPDAQIVPVDPRRFHREKVPWLEELEGHVVTIQEIAHTPYPMFVLSVTLDTALSDHEVVLLRIRDEWQRKKILENRVTLEFDAAHLLGRGKAKIDHLSIRERKLSSLPRSMVTSGEIDQFCMSTIDEEVEVELDDEVIDDRFKAYMFDVIVRYLSSTHFAEGYDVVDFYDGQRLRLFDSLESLGTPNEEIVEKVVIDRTTASELIN